MPWICYSVDIPPAVLYSSVNNYALSIILYSGKFWQENVWQIYYFWVFDKNICQINRSTIILLIVSTNMDDCSMSNHGWFIKVSCYMLPAKCMYVIWPHHLYWTHTGVHMLLGDYTLYCHYVECYRSINHEWLVLKTTGQMVINMTYNGIITLTRMTTFARCSSVIP